MSVSKGGGGEGEKETYKFMSVIDHGAQFTPWEVGHKKKHNKVQAKYSLRHDSCASHGHLSPFQHVKVRTRNDKSLNSTRGFFIFIN